MAWYGSSSLMCSRAGISMKGVKWQSAFHTASGLGGRRLGAVMTSGTAYVLLVPVILLQPATASAKPGNGGGGGGNSSSCQIQALTGVAFGNFNPLAGISDSSMGSVTIYCQGKKTIVISLSTGQSNTYAPRYMASPATATHLNYNLYTDAGHTQIWGDGTNGTLPVTQNLQNSSVSDTIYGMVPSQPTVVPGQYSDTITLTVAF